MQATIKTTRPKKTKKQGFVAGLLQDFKKYRGIYLILIPVLLYYIVFHYIPMGGTVIAFQDYIPARGFLGSKWVGLRNFIDYLSSPYAFRTITNTLLINLYDLIFGFPMPILLALMINEVRNSKFKKTVQTISYMPFFISMVVMCGLIVSFTKSDGLVNAIINVSGGTGVNLLSKPQFYRSIYIISNIWKSVGWGSIIYLATLSSVDLNLYEAASIDGAGRLKQIFHITLPSLVPVISIQLILKIGRMFSEGFEKTILIYNPLIYKTADIISSYVYRRGLQEMDYSFGAAVDMFNSIANLTLLLLANWFSKRYVKESLW